MGEVGKHWAQLLILLLYAWSSAANADDKERRLTAADARAQLVDGIVLGQVPTTSPRAFFEITSGCLTPNNNPKSRLADCDATLASREALPDDRPLYLQERAKALIGLGRVQEGLRQLEPVIAVREKRVAAQGRGLAPDKLTEDQRDRRAELAHALRLRARALAILGDGRSAMRDIDEVLLLAPAWANVWWLWADRGFAYLALGDDVRARSDFLQAIQRNEGREAYQGLCRLEAKVGNVAMAIAICPEWVKIEPDNPESYIAVGRALLAYKTAPTAAASQEIAQHAQQITQHALAAFEKALTVQPSSADGLYGRGLARLRGGDAGGQTDVDAAKRSDASVASRF